MDKVTVTPDDMADIVVRMAQLGLPSDVQGVLLHGNNRGTVPSRVLERALSDFLARHRHAAMLEGVRLGLEAALNCVMHRDDRPAKPSESPTQWQRSMVRQAIATLDPAAIVEGVK